MATVLRERAPAVAPAPPLPLKRFTIEEYHRMLDVGILLSGDPVELLEGVLCQKMTKNPPHAVCVTLCNDALRKLLPPGWFIGEQNPVSMVPDSEPEPDLAIVRGTPRNYVDRHPVPREIALIIEVADTSLLGDRNYKGLLYARGRIPVYWIVNLPDARLEVYTNPRAGKTPAYRSRQDYGKDESVPLTIAGQVVGSVAVRDLLP